MSQRADWTPVIKGLRHLRSLTGMKSPTGLNLPLIFPSPPSVLFPGFQFCFMSMLTLNLLPPEGRPPGGSGPPHPHTLTFPSPHADLHSSKSKTCFSAQVGQASHSKTFMGGKTSVQIAPTSTWFLRFLLRMDLAYLLPFMFMPNTSPLLIIP